MIGTVQNLRARRLDNSYACTFYPGCKPVMLEPVKLSGFTSVAMMGVFGSSQAKSDVWFAPAIFNCGGLSDAPQDSNLNASSNFPLRRDSLYDININPIASFPSTGIVVFGRRHSGESQHSMESTSADCYLLEEANLGSFNSSSLRTKRSSNLGQIQGSY